MCVCVCVCKYDLFILWSANTTRLFVHLFETGGIHLLTHFVPMSSLFDLRLDLIISNAWVRKKLLKKD